MNRTARATQPAWHPAEATEFSFEARVSVETPLVVGESSHGLRRVVPITGGTFEGPNIRGRVLPIGADFQYVRPDGVLAVEARYTLETSDGVLIMVTNRGIRRASPDVMERLGRGEAVDPSESVGSSPSRAIARQDPRSAVATPRRPAT